MKHFDIIIPVSDSDEVLSEKCKAACLSMCEDWANEGIEISDIDSHIFKKGVTNKCVKIWPKKPINGLMEQDGGVIVARVFGLGTASFLSRENELLCWNFLHQNNHAAKVVAQFTNGLLSGHLPGRTITTDEMKMSDFQSLIAGEMATVHKLDYSDYLHKKLSLQSEKDKRREGDDSIELDVWRVMDHFNSMVPWADIEEESKAKSEDKTLPADCAVKTKVSKKWFDAEVLELRKYLQKFKSPIVFAHNDVNQNNVIFNEEQKSVLFIDYEYGGLNPRGYDIGNFLCEFMSFPEAKIERYPSKEEQLPFLERYLQDFGGDIDVDSLYKEANAFSLASHLYWGVWALLQHTVSNIDFDFFEYACIRFHAYLIFKERFGHF